MEKEDWNYQTLHKLVERGENSPKNNPDRNRGLFWNNIQKEIQKALETINILRSEKTKLKIVNSELNSKNLELYKKASRYKESLCAESKRRKRLEKTNKELEDIIRDLEIQKSDLELKIQNFQGINPEI